MAGTGERRRTGVLRRFARAREGAAALEFGLIGVIFLALVLFVVALGFRLYVHVALDYASSRAARLLAVDRTQSRSANEATFQAVSFCPLLSPFLTCGNVTLSLRAVTDYRTGSPVGGAGAPSFDAGQGGSLMLLQATYRLPGMSWPSPAGDGTASSFEGAAVTVGYPYQNEY